MCGMGFVFGLNKLVLIDDVGFFGVGMVTSSGNSFKLRLFYWSKISLGDRYATELNRLISLLVNMTFTGFLQMKHFR